MQFSSKPTREQKVAAMRKKAESALKQKEKELQVRRAKTARLRALRLERDAELEASNEERKTTVK